MPISCHHVLWTRPQLNPALDAFSQELSLWDFELLTWALSLLYARRLGPVSLITDSRGATAAERAGLAAFYNGGISTSLDSIPAELDCHAFWAGGKLYAYRHAKAPCLFIDLDAVLWRPIDLTSRIMALHAENRHWPWYSANEHNFRRFGFNHHEWDWTLDPFNTGVLFLGDADALAHYAQTATTFAESYSRALGVDPKLQPNGNEVMLFAEQRLLPMCAARHGITVHPIAPAPIQASCLPANPQCLHLWRAKLAYKLCPDSRLAAVNWMIDSLLRDFPEVRPVLARWHLDHPQKQTATTPPPDPAMFAEVHQADLRFSLIKNSHGIIRVKDLTTGITRRAAHGSMVWSGEIIHPDPGACFELEVLGLQSLQFRAMP